MSVTVVIVMFFAVAALAVGWVMNVIEIFHTADASLTGVFVLRCFGVIVAPLGGVLGYF